jgi:nicotinate phosphoribosyltransferase
VKNIMRFYNGKRQVLADLIYLEEEAGDLERRIGSREPIRFNHPATEYARFTLSEYSTTKKLLEPVMLNGAIVGTQPSIQDIKMYRQGEVDSLDETFKRLLNPHIYKISLSDRLKNLKSELIHEIKSNYDNI